MPFQIVWTLNKDGNTGYLSFPMVLGSATSAKTPLELSGSSVQVQCIPNIDALEDWCNSNGFIKHPTPLPEAVGVHLICYAKPYNPSKEHRGKNNVIATYMTCTAEAGLAPATIVGKAAFVRTTTTGKPVSFERAEFLRLGLFINDLMDAYGYTPNVARMLQAAQAVYPYYNPFDMQDTFQHLGFVGKAGRSLCLDDSDQLVDNGERVLEVYPTFSIPQDNL